MPDQLPSTEGAQARAPTPTGRRPTYGEMGLGDSFRAIVEGIKAVRIWWALSQADIRSRYRRSFLGPNWMTLTSAITVLGLGYLWGELWHADLKQFYPYVAAGIITWNYIASILAESPSTFTQNIGYLKHQTAPLFIYPMRSASKLFLLFLHQLPVVIIIVLLFAPMPKPIALLSLVGIALIGINSIWISALLGLLGARLRDIAFIIEAVVPLMFFLTPVIWRVSDLSRSHVIADINPLYHAIETVRAPLLGEMPSMTSYLMLVCSAIVGWTLTWIAFQYRRRIVFWVQ